MLVIVIYEVGGEVHFMLAEHLFIRTDILHNATHHDFYRAILLTEVRAVLVILECHENHQE